jgi:deoxyribodipyrimidine photo-lyase
LARAAVWFREDLRIEDHPALFHATQLNKAVIAIYVIDRTQWQNHDVAPCRIQFVLRGLKELNESLSKINIPLIILEVKNPKDTPEEIFKLLSATNIASLYFNHQYEVNESRRDQAVEKYLVPKNIRCYSFDDQIILTPGSVLSQKGEYFKVFTAYKHAWIKEFRIQKVKLLPRPKPQSLLEFPPTIIPTLFDFQSSVDPTLWPAGEQEAQKKLAQFIMTHLFDYDKTRDFPAVAGTSQLSPYLATGMISARRCFLAALEENQHELDSGNKGALTWMTELIWRDFYKHLLVNVPRVSMNQPYKIATKKIRWHHNQHQFEAWTQGKTGYPIIDAAMRQLNTTGWMHNRLRMIVAMFFAKNLFLDWRLGERYFMQHLIDGDLAANNGGWQWCASTGTDSAPYFRIFNPVTQSQRFDSEGHFIRQYCPELTAFNDRDIHDPHHFAPKLARHINYPTPIVDLKKSRVHAIEVFKNL